MVHPALPLLTRARGLPAGLVAAAFVAAWAAGFIAPARAEKADRSKPLTMESDQPCTVDLARQLSVCRGNVVIAQGTLQLRAERIEIRETPDGYRSAVAIGTAAQPAQYRQKRDSGQNEFVEGVAERIEFDGKADTLKFVGNAAVRRLRAGAVADEIQGSQITWDNTAELFSVQGGSSTASNPGGRVRAVLAPREVPSPPAAAPAASSALRTSPQLGERR